MMMVRSAGVSVERLIDLLRECLREEPGSRRVKCVKEFQRTVWAYPAQIGSHEQDRLLRDLAYDLDFFEPNPKARGEDQAYFDDARLSKILAESLAALNRDRQE
jgi:hypothetical protein